MEKEVKLGFVIKMLGAHLAVIIRKSSVTHERFALTNRKRTRLALSKSYSCLYLTKYCSISSISVCHKRTTNVPIMFQPSNTLFGTKMYTRKCITWVRLLECLPMRLPLYLHMYSVLRQGVLSRSRSMLLRHIQKCPWDATFSSARQFGPRNTWQLPVEWYVGFP